MRNGNFLQTCCSRIWEFAGTTAERSKLKLKCHPCWGFFRIQLLQFESEQTLRNTQLLVSNPNENNIKQKNVFLVFHALLWQICCMCLVQLLVAHVLHVQQIPCKITCRTDCVKLTRRKAFLVLLKPYYDFDSFQITKYSNVRWQPTQSLGAWVNSASAFAFLHQTPCSSTFWSYGTWACCSNWELRPNADHLKAYFSQCD